MNSLKWRHSRKSRTMENTRWRDHPVIIKLHDGGRWQARSYKRSAIISRWLHTGHSDRCRDEQSEVRSELSASAGAAGMSSCSPLIDVVWDETTNDKGQMCLLQPEVNVFLFQDQSFHLQMIDDWAGGESDWWGWESGLVRQSLSLWPNTKKM